ncbi:MAG TPA: helix-turn-helix transcriptional regulator, partial [Thermoanaerobaculia bacterium]|nr:helix-turn-helix transcriptional regulator [Thermoanaerobaculia bacterium]
MRLNPDWVYKMLRRPEIPKEDFERLLPHVQRRPAEALVVTRCLEELEALDQEQDLTDAEQEEVERGVLEASRHLRAHLVEGVRRSRGVPSLDGYPTPSEVEPARWQAGMLWTLLKEMTEDQRSVVVRSVREFQSWALMERVCEESVIEASRDLERAASLARLAEEIAATIRGPETWCKRCLGYAAAHLPNVQRVLGDLQTARAGLEHAKALWEMGSDPDRVLDPGRLLDLEASLYRDERRFEEGLDCLDRALSVSHRPGHVLVNKGFTLEVMGEYELGIEALFQAKPLIERKGDVRLRNILDHNLSVLLCHVERYSDAARLGGEVRALAERMGDEIGSLRGLWLEGRIAAGLGQSAKARALLEQAAQELTGREMWYSVALAQLEIAVLLLQEDRSAEVQALALDLGKVFNAKGIHREALAALRLFQESVARGEATAELARRVLRFLFRARYDQGLRFNFSGALGTTVGIPTAAVVEGRLAGLVSPATEAVGVPAATVIESVLPGTAAEAAGVPNTTVVEGDLSQQLVDKGHVAGRGQKCGGEGDGDKSGSHRKVSGAAPAPGLHGPGGPRLPGMVRQEGGKNSPDFLAAARPGWKTLLVRLFRALCGETQKAFAEALDVEPAVVAQYELGKCEPGPELMERMAQRAALTTRAGEEVLHFADTLRRPRQRTGLRGLPEELAAVASRVYQRLLRLHLAARPPRAEDRRCVDELWSRLKDLTEEQQLTVVRVGPEFQSWALAEWLMEESVTEASRDLERAAALARLAREVADRVPGPEDWQNRIRGYAEAALP